jgi:hypothetical protein
VNSSRNRVKAAYTLEAGMSAGKEWVKVILRKEDSPAAEDPMAVEIRAVDPVTLKKRNKWNYGCPFN